jgi:hypothetical protein
MNEERIRQYVAEHFDGSEEQLERLLGLERAMLHHGGSFALLAFFDPHTIPTGFETSPPEPQLQFCCGPLDGEELHLPTKPHRPSENVIGLPMKVYVEGDMQRPVGEMLSRAREGPLRQPLIGALAYPEHLYADWHFYLIARLYVSDQRVIRWLADNMLQLTWMHDIPQHEFDEPHRFGERILGDIANRCNTLLLTQPREH